MILLISRSVCLLFVNNSHILSQSSLGKELYAAFPKLSGVFEVFGNLFDQRGEYLSNLRAAYDILQF